MKKIVILMLAILSFISTISCQKDEVTNTVPISLSTDKSQYAPHEIVTITGGDNIFSTATQSGKINGIDVELVIDENKVAFVLPDFQNGNYNLKFSSGNKNYDVPVMVTLLSSISSGDTYFYEMQANMNDNISELSNHITELQTSEGNSTEVQALQNDLVFYQNQLNSFSSQYNNLSSEEKTQFAETIAANQAILNEYNMLTSDFNQSASILRNNQTVQDYETQVEICKGKFVASVIFTVGHIPLILAGGKVAAASGGNPGVLLALGVVVTSFMINVVNTGTMAQTLTLKSLKPYEFITQTSQIIYSNGVETVSEIQAKYRSLLNSDSNNNGSTINTIVEKYNFFKDKCNGFITELPAVFRPSFIMTSLKNTYNSTTRSIFNQYVNITNISNPNVTLQKLNQPDGSIKIKASTTETTAQNFTYDVNYTNSNFSNGLTKTVNAQVLGLDPCNQGTMTAPTITNVQLECNTNNIISILVSFTADGTGAVIGEGSGWCDPINTCYPTRLYFFSPGATEYSIAYNSYNVTLKSGNLNSGVIEITLNGKLCINGQTASQSLESYYANYNWKVELMNQCNQRSNQVSF